MENFKKTITVQATATAVYHALTQEITQWWTSMFEGSANQQGDTFTICFGDTIFKTLLVQELISQQKVVWLVTNALLDIPELENKTEWINTKIIWDIAAKAKETEIQLTHIGLNPQVACYDVCANGWHNFTDSLTAFVNTGKGKPFLPSI